jgi:hypothetical protein
MLAQAKLRPHRLREQHGNDDPEFDGKAADIIGLHLNFRSIPSRSA